MLRRCFFLGVLAAALIAAFAGADSPGAIISAPGWGRASVQASSLPPSAPQAEVILTVPFENSSRRPSLDWLREGFAELTIERLGNQGPHFLSRQERLSALEDMGLPAETILGRASMFKLAEQVGADNVIFGGYTSDGQTVTVKARILHIDPPALSAEFTQSGPVGELMTLHARLAWQLLCALGRPWGNPPGNQATNGQRCGKDVNEADFTTKLLVIPPSAFEFYIRGLIGSSEEQQFGDLRQAAKLAPAWPSPGLALADAYFLRRDCDSTLAWLSRAPRSEGTANPVAAAPAPAPVAHSIAAAFEAGVCRLLQNDPVAAAAALTPLLGPATSTNGVPEVYNDMGIALAREGKMPEAITALARATQIDAQEPDYWFNLGLARMRANQFDSAAAALRRALGLQPADSEARALFAAALEQSGQVAEAAVERSLLSRATVHVSLPKNPSLSDLARLDRVSMLLDFDSVSTRPAAASATAMAAPIAITGAAGPAAASNEDRPRLTLHLDRGREFLNAGDFDDAQRAFMEALLLAPLDAEGHAGLAEVYWRKGRPEDGMREFRTALASRDDAETRVSLAQLLVEQKRPADARTELEHALSLDPSNADARQLMDELRDSSPTGVKQTDGKQ